ncbi:NPCBM/NEW2 domain-containing protein [bacterium]|nr:NPCBM/NEW2 domain-containing protein [bacterium]
MKKKLFFLFSIICLVSVFCLPRLSEAGITALIALRQDYFTNCMAHAEHAKIGDTEIESYILGMGGADAATIRYEVKGRYDMFESIVGFSDSAPEGRICTFELLADGELITKVGPLTSGEGNEIIKGNIKGANFITLRMVPGKYNGTANAMWGDPKLYSDLKKNENPGSLVLHINGKLHQVNPNKVNGKTQISVPFILKPGQHTYIIKTSFDEEQNQADIEVQNPDGSQAVVEQTSKKAKSKNKKSRLPQPVTIRADKDDEEE